MRRISLLLGLLLLAGCGGVRPAAPAPGPTAQAPAPVPARDVPPELATPGVWVPVSGFEAATGLTRPVTIWVTGDDPDRPHPPGTPVDFTVSVWNPDSLNPVRLSGLELSYRIERYAPPGPLVPVYSAKLPPLSAVLPARAGYAVRVRWDQRDAGGTQAAVGAQYAVDLLPATISTDAGTARFDPSTRSHAVFTLTWPDAPAGTLYGPWQAEADGLRVTVGSMRLRPAGTELQMWLQAAAFRAVASQPEAVARTASGEVPLLTGGSCLADLLPAWQYPVRLGMQFFLTPVPPGTAELLLRWRQREDGQVLLALVLPVAATGPPPSTAQLAGLDRIAAALDAAFAPELPQWDREALRQARRTRATAEAFLRHPDVGWSPGMAPDDAPRRQVFRRAAAALLTIPGVEAFTFISAGGVMTWERRRLAELDDLDDVALDQAAGYR